MSAQRLNPKSVRRIARSTGLNVVRAWGHGSYIHQFVTDTHQHGWWDVGTQEWGLYTSSSLRHYSSCEELFPGYKDQDPELLRRKEAREAVARAYDLNPATLLPNELPLADPVEAGEGDGKVFTVVFSEGYATDLGVANLSHYWRVALNDSGGVPIAGVEPTVTTLVVDADQSAYVVAGRALPPNG